MRVRTEKLTFVLSVLVLCCTQLFAQAPTITSLSPLSGPVGTQVTISGAGFGSTQGNSTIQLGAAYAQVVTWSDTTIVAAAPSGTSSGTFTVTVGGQAANTSPFSITALPSGWLDQDVGSVGRAGNASYANGAFSVAGDGNFGAVAADGFHFVYQPMSGDGTIVARVVSATSGYAYAGVMMRETLDAGSKSIFVGAYTGYAYTYYRTTPGATSGSYHPSWGIALPAWMKLVRSGSSFTTYVSSDGVNWTLLTAQTINMATDFYVGLAVSYGGSTLYTGVFDNVSINSATAPSPVITGISATTGSVGSQIVISGLNFGESQQSSVVRLNGALVPVSYWSDSSITTTIPANATSGYLAVRVAPTMNASNPVTFTVTAQPLPSGWWDEDVGSVGRIGSATYGSGAFTVVGGGGTLNGTTADGFHFVYQPMSGDGTIVARVVSMTSGYAYAGVMMRETLDAGSKGIFVGAYMGGAYTFYRITTGATSGSYHPSFGTALPAWMKLVRSGSSFTTYVSSDGVNWILLTTQTINMSTDFYVGLAVSSGSGSDLYTGVFDNVSVSSVEAPNPEIIGLSATTGAVGSQVVISGANFGGSQGGSEVRLHGALVTVNSWSDSSITITIPANATSGYLVVLNAPTMNASNPVTFTVTAQPLPSGWSDRDVGWVRYAGNSSYTSGSFTIAGAGGLAAVAADSFHFVYQPMSGDGMIVARVASLSYGYMYAGVMMRETMDPGAKSIFMGPMNTYSFFRTTNGATSGSANPFFLAVPLWTKIVRSGSTFTAYACSDGINWRQVTSQTINMTQNIYVGLAVSAYSGTDPLRTGVLDNVSVSSAGAPAAVITGLSATTGSVGSQVVISGSNFGSAQGSSIVRLSGATVPVSSWSDNSITITIPAEATSGNVVVSVAPTMNSSNPVKFTITSQPLPSTWSDRDIGSVASAGSAGYTSGSFTIAGAGGLAAVAADSLHFVYQPMSGDGTIVARVVSLSYGYMYAGVMMRETMDPGAKSIFVGPMNTCSYYRTTVGMTDSSSCPFLLYLPYWTKIVRSGNSFTAYASADGKSWRVVAGPVQISMSQTIYVGLAVSAFTSTEGLQSAVFDNVAVTSNVTVTPVITGVSATTGPVGTRVVISGLNFGASQGSSTVLLHDTPVTVNSWSNTSITITIPTGATSGLLNVLVAPMMNSSNALGFTVTSQPLPSGWLDQDIGQPTQAGSATYQNGAFTILGPGRVDGTADSFHFVYQPLSTDGTITARAVSTSNGAGYLGVMIRETLDAAAPEVSSTFLKGNNIPIANYRTYVGGWTSTATGQHTGVLAYWLKVVRASNTFTAYASQDNLTWTQVGSVQTLTTAQTVYVGLVSLPGGTSTTSTFDNVSVIPGASLPNPSITSLAPLTGATGISVTLSGSGFGGTQGTSSVQFNGVPATVSSWSDSQIVAFLPDAATTGPVTVTVGGVTGQGPTFTVSFAAQVTDSLGNASSYVSAPAGGSWSFTDSQGSGCSSCTARNTIHNQYDGLGNLLWTTDALGHTVINRYDSSNNLISESVEVDANTTATTTYTYNSFGEVLTVTDALGNKTTNTYDSKGNLLTVTAPKPDANTAASLTTFGYDTKGELTTITDPLNHVTTIAYNPVGLIQSITDANNQTTTYEYDSHGNRTAVVDAMQHRTEFAYDARDRLTTITYPDTTTSSFGYDSRGRRTSVTDQNGKTTTYAYDDADRLISVTDAAQNTTQYAYDTENNLLSITDAKSRVTSFTYDAFGRVTQTAFPSSLAETYGYDALGNLTNKTDRNGQAITYVYDALNRLTHKGYPSSGGVDYVYDLVGKIKQVTDPTGTYGFAYDNMGRLIGTTTQYSYLPTTTFTNLYTYDAASNRKTFRAPDASTNNYAYDLLNRMTDLTNSWAGHFGFSYDNLSRRTQLAKPNGINTTYSYDSVSRLLSVLHQAGAVTIDGASYTNDNAGNRTAKQNLLSGTTDNYSYDPVYQLTQVLQAANTTEAYSYDEVGNRLSAVGTSGWQYNSSNQLTSTPSVTYTYDNNGNTLTKLDSTGTTQYAWDVENRLASLTLPGDGGVVTFKYDPFGRRIEKITASGATLYVYDGANIVGEYDSSGTLIAKYAQGAGIDEPLAMSRQGSTVYYNADGLGSVTSLDDAGANQTATYQYDAFGKSTGTTGSLFNPFRYTGREWDQETGLYYYRARYYDPAQGRFLSEDPLRFRGSGPNFYGYVHGNPTNWIDPLGLTDCTKPGNQNRSGDCFQWYGNWGGPGWTGGQWKPYEDLTPDEQAHLAPPIDAQDACYMQHDLCYAHSRVENKCTADDNPTAQQSYQDDQDTAQCDKKLAMCLSAAAWQEGNWHIGLAEPVFLGKWLWKAWEADPDAPRPPCGGMNCIENK